MPHSFLRYEKTVMILFLQSFETRTFFSSAFRSLSPKTCPFFLISIFVLTYVSSFLLRHEAGNGSTLETSHQHFQMLVHHALQSMTSSAHVVPHLFNSSSNCPIHVTPPHVPGDVRFPAEPSTSHVPVLSNHCSVPTSLFYLLFPLHKLP